LAQVVTHSPAFELDAAMLTEIVIVYVVAPMVTVMVMVLVDPAVAVLGNVTVMVGAMLSPAGSVTDWLAGATVAAAAFEEVAVTVPEPVKPPMPVMVMATV